MWPATAVLPRASSQFGSGPGLFDGCAMTSSARRTLTISASSLPSHQPTRCAEKLDLISPGRTASQGPRRRVVAPRGKSGRIATVRNSRASGRVHPGRKDSTFADGCAVCYTQGCRPLAPAPRFAMETDRNVLFGVLALRAGLIDADQFAAACDRWAGQRNRPLAELLLRPGALSETDRPHVDYLLD